MWGGNQHASEAPGRSSTGPAVFSQRCRMNRAKLADLTSGVGALVLGVGWGALFPRWFGPAAAVITIVGLSLHAFGMWDKHRLEATSSVENPIWVVALYWMCWLLLAGVLAMLLFWRR